jgi:hypothetical protein
MAILKGDTGRLGVGQPADVAMNIGFLPVVVESLAILRERYDSKPAQV